MKVAGPGQRVLLRNSIHARIGEVGTWSSCWEWELSAGRRNRGSQETWAAKD